MVLLYYKIILALPAVAAPKTGHVSRHWFIRRSCLKLVVGRLDALAFTALELAHVVLVFKRFIRLPLVVLHPVLQHCRRVWPIWAQYVWWVPRELGRIKLFFLEPICELRRNQIEFHRHLVTLNCESDLDVGASPELCQEPHGLAFVCRSKQTAFPCCF